MNIMTLINALPGAVAQGLIWGIMAIGVYLTFRILDFADLTVDGSMCTGGGGLHYDDAGRFWCLAIHAGSHGCRHAHRTCYRYLSHLHGESRQSFPVF